MLKMLKIMLIILLSLKSTLLAEDNFGKALNFKIETENFIIIYNSNMLKVANDLALNIEKWGGEVFKSFNNTRPQSKIFIVLGNYSDVVNAFSFSNSIVMHFTPTTNYNFHRNWLESTFKHELSHNLIRLYDYNLFITYALNPLLDATIPRWYHEGFAVFNETNLTNGQGRNNNEEFQSEIRYKFNNKVANYFYYNGMDPYSDGAPFFEFYQQKYGQETHQKARTEYLSKLINRIILSPITVYANMAHITVEELYEDYNKYLENYYRAPSREHVEGELLFEDNFDYDNYLLNFLEVDNNNLYYYAIRKNKITGKNNLGVFSFNLTEHNHKKLLYINQSAEYIYKQGQDIYYNRVDKSNYLGTQYSKSYHYNMEKKVFSTTKLSGDRILKTIPTLKGLYQVIGNQNKQSLIKAETQEVIISFDNNMVFDKFYYNPTSNSVFFAAGIVNSNEDIAIYQYNLNNKILLKLVNGKDPSVDNNILYYSYNADGGRYNIYSLNLLTAKVTQLTDTNYGAFNPIYKNGVLYYVSYYGSNKGIYSLLKRDFLNKEINNAFIFKEVNYTNNVLNINFLQDDIDHMNKEHNSLESSNIYNGSNNSGNNTSLSTAEKISVFDYKLDGLGIGLDYLGVSLSALNNTNKIMLGVKNVDYSSYFLNGGNKYAVFFDFIYNPRDLLNDDGLFTLKSSYANNDNAILEAGLNPIIYNGFNNIPTVLLNTSYSSTNDYKLGSSFNWQDNNLLLQLGYQSQDSQKKSYNFYKLKAFRVFEVSYFSGQDNYYNLDIGNGDFDNLQWKKVSDKVLHFYLERPFEFKIYQGRRDGRFSIDTFTFKPYVSNFYATAAGNYHNSAFFGVDNYFTGIFNYNIKYGLGLSLYYQNIYEKIDNNEGNISKGSNMGYKFLVTVFP